MVGENDVPEEMADGGGGFAAGWHAREEEVGEEGDARVERGGVGVRCEAEEMGPGVLDKVFLVGSEVAEVAGGYC